MPDGQLPDPGDTAVTTELALARRSAGPPTTDLDAALREQLPGLEPDRDVTDWGRSERVTSLADATLLGFLYHYWFRVEAEGIENIPSREGALLVANRAGRLLLDGAMIARALREERRRPLHVASARSFADVPGIGMLATKLGAVAAHPANLQRLLLDEQQLVLCFPEATQRGARPLRWRYRLGAFDGLPFVDAAMRARVPIVPVAVVGGEEATPTLGSLGPIERFQRQLPLTPGLPLPAKFRLRFLQPVGTEELGEAPWSDRALVRALAEDVRGLVQENLLEMLAARRSVWLG